MKVPDFFIKRLCSTFSITILLINVLSGQNIKFINNTNNISPLVIIISQDGVFDDMADSILNLQNKTKASFLLINASWKSTGEIIDTVNLILNKENQIDKTKIYLIIVGDKIFFENQNKFSNDLFPSKYFIQTDNQTIAPTPFVKVSYNDMNLKKIVNEQNKSNLWQFDLDQIRKLSLENIEPNYKSWEIGLGYSKHYPGPIRTDDDFPRDISSYELQISRNLNEKYKIWSSMTVNKIMLGKKKKEEEMQTLDFDIDKQIVESIMFSRSLNLTRFFYVTQSPGFKPYLAMGISHTHLSLMYMEAKGSNPDMEMKMYSCGSLMLTSGLEINLAEKLRLNTKMSYHISLNTYNTMNNFNVTFGLSYVLQRKKKPHYEYLRLK